MVNDEASSVLAMEPDPSPSEGRKIAPAVWEEEKHWLGRECW